MGSMKAAVFQGPGGTARQDVPDPGVAVEAARLPETFEACTRTVRPGVRVPDPPAAA
ncbi:MULTISPECIES: hypothetical protein [unclassified Streptomyces]|uniref:hypothetical protein n=1 Tax=unclassified Streptomyces TaxID=2593676 RepID=UPI0035DF49EC